MSLRLQDDCSFFGSALPEPFVLGDLEPWLAKEKLLPKAIGAEGKKLTERWSQLRRSLRALGEVGGPQRVANHVLAPLVAVLGYEKLERQDEAVRTREGDEDAGWLFVGKDGAKLRVWSVDMNADLDAPSKRGHAYRFSPSRIANRVLLTKGERLGLLTDGIELRLLISDPARSESHLIINLGGGGWRSRREVPDSFRLLLALGSPAGVRKLPELTEAARLSQTKVTAKLREQAKLAVLGFLQSIFEDARNKAALEPAKEDAYPELARRLWSEALIVVYRLLFILKLESSPDPARAFSFASNSLWRNTYSPNFALGRVIEDYSRKGVPTGTMLSDGLRALFIMFCDGLAASGLKVSPLGGMLFGKDSTPILDACAWSEEAVRCLLENLLWTPRAGRDQPQRVHYGSLDVEDLGRVYEALLELEPGISTEPMCRLRRAKLEVVVPLEQGKPYRKNAAFAESADEADEEGEESEERSGGKKTKVQWIEEIPPGHFYLRVGLGRKASGSYYTPDAFVRFLVQETLEPQVAERSPKDDPKPDAILKLKALDPAMGSGHFLVGACRFLADKLYEACRLCDELASKAEEKAEKEKSEEKRAALRTQAAELRKRVEELPDPNDELVSYLPSHVPEGEQSGLSQAKALAICRRLVAVHCLYGVDKNPLAVELAKVSLWLESYAEGLPLTFLDHRLVLGDSLTGPFLADLMTFPGTGQRIDDLLAKDLAKRLQAGVARAMQHVRQLEASVGKDVADVEAKRNAKQKLDEELAPFKLLAVAWSGGVQLGRAECDDQAYLKLAKAVAGGQEPFAVIQASRELEQMVASGKAGVAYDLVFPEVFHGGEYAAKRTGFDAIVGNPPWDALQPYAKEFYAAFDLRVLDAPTKRERAEIEKRLEKRSDLAAAFQAYSRSIDGYKRVLDRLFKRINQTAGGAPSGAALDLWQPFAERAVTMLASTGQCGMVLPSAFHANQSATGERELYINDAGLRLCYSFENRNKLFDIDSRFKFAAVVARRAASARGELSCAFYLHDLQWLFDDQEPLQYDRNFVRETGGEYYSLLELRTLKDAEVAKHCYSTGMTFGEERERFSVHCGEEMHMTKAAHLFTSIEKALVSEDPREPDVASALLEKGFVALHEGKTFHQFNDHWDAPPRYLVGLDKVADKPGWLRPSRYFRLAFRDIASSTNERTGIFCLLPPGVLCGNTAPCERAPEARPNSVALNFLAVVNAHTFDWALRQKSATHVSQFILDGCPVPPAAFVGDRARFLAHAALRLSCNHEGYAPLWMEQLGEEWREAAPNKNWPVLGEEADRWAVRAAIDAVVADAYGLAREHYEHVLGSFSHKSFPDAPKLCLAAFDELKTIGLEAFLKKQDPYWNVPLNKELPKPVIELAIPEQKAGGQGQLPGMGTAVGSGRRPRKRA